MTATKKLTIKQELFVQNYLIDLNATQAAIRAGYSERTARKIGSENLSKPDISAAIQSAAQDRIERTQIDADYVLQMTDELLKRCMQKEPVLDSDGNPTGEWKFDSAGASRALKLLGDHVAIGAFKPSGDVVPAPSPEDFKWTVTIVHMTKDDYDRREKCIEHNP
jgi:phage terminase small subunit